MKMGQYFLIRFLLGISPYLLISTFASLHPNVGLDEFQLMAKYGYPFEKYDITTEDGYILEMIRVLPRLDGGNISNPAIPYKIYPHLKSSVPKQPLLLMHGIIAGARDFMSHDPEKAMAFFLVNHGYDVFLGNCRGSTRSRRHVTLDPDKDAQRFWDFSWHEIGLYDLPAMINYILQLTEFRKVVYMGHSQGGTTFYVMCSMRPEMNDKIKIAITLASPAMMKYSPSEYLRSIANLEGDIYALIQRVQIYEFFRYSSIYMDIMKVMTDEQFGLTNLVYQSSTLIRIANFRNMDLRLVPAILTSYPTGSSFNQVIHFLQSMRTGQFRLFDYHDKSKNFEKYGSIEPPDYNLSAITCKTVMYCSDGDIFVNCKDLLMASSKMKNTIPVEIKVPGFTHSDYIWAKHIINYLLKDVLWHLKNA